MKYKYIDIAIHYLGTNQSFPALLFSSVDMLIIDVVDFGRKPLGFKVVLLVEFSL